MAANGISTLPFKRDRQDAKLAAAASKRASTGRPSTLDASLLPSRYAVGDNTTENRDKRVGSPPQQGRPWT